VSATVQEPVAHVLPQVRDSFLVLQPHLALVLALRRISLMEVVAGVRQVRVSVVNGKEGVACRVCVGLPAALVITGVGRHCAELDDLVLGLVEIPDSQVRWNCCGWAGSGHRGGW
jgi:hypothetical protein